MLVPFVIVAVIAIGLLVMLVLARQRRGRLVAERDDLSDRLESTTAELATTNETLSTTKAELATTERRVADLTAQNVKLTGEVAELNGAVEEVNETLRKRTELADAQAEQIEALSGARDDLQLKVTAAEEQIVALTARPEVVVGRSADDPGVETLWDLEVARSERSWRTSVAIDPTSETSPFAGTDDPVRTAVEIEAAALREDVGALIAIDWKAAPIESAARRMLVVRVAHELLAQASRAPGAARLIVTDGDDGALTFSFEADDDGLTLDLTPPPVSTEVLDVRRDTGLTVTVLAE